MANAVIHSRVVFCILWLHDLICFVHSTKLKTVEKINKDETANVLRTDCWLVRQARNNLSGQKWKPFIFSACWIPLRVSGAVDYLSFFLNVLLNTDGCGWQVTCPSKRLSYGAWKDSCHKEIWCLHSSLEFYISVFMRKLAGSWKGEKDANVKSTQRGL